MWDRVLDPIVGVQDPLGHCKGRGAVEPQDLNPKPY